ncbi:MAG: hypothetical protein RLP15_12205 [Cryomorphaceae bacterium]
MPILIILILSSFIGCVNEKARSDKVEIDNSTSSVQTEEEKLKSSIKKLQKCDFNFDSLYHIYRDNEPFEDYLIKEEHSWLFSELKDKSRFDKADDIKILCKLFENQNISSIAFTDVYDYKQAIHVINFKKPHYEPVSSFILYSTGGDAEDFWDRVPERISDSKYRVVDVDGYYNDIERLDTVNFKSRVITEIEIDTNNGTKRETRISKESDFVEIRN